MNKKDEEEYVKVCPNCGSTDIEVGEEISRKLTDVFGVDSEFRCNNCGHLDYFHEDKKQSSINAWEWDNLE